MKPLAAVILAAGRGERMNSDTPKVLHSAGGAPLVRHVLDAISGLGIKKIAVVVGSHGKAIRSFLKGVIFVQQDKQLGTGHAVLQTKPQFGNWQGDLLVMPADAPCVKAETIAEFVKEHRDSEASASILTADVAQPKGYGRILRRGQQVIAIREELDLSSEEKEITEINSGIYLFNAEKLFRHLISLKQNAKKKEYYLTDVIDAFAQAGDLVRAHKIESDSEVLGVNTRGELSVAHQILNAREIERHLNAGVTILDPNQTVIAKGVTIGRDTVIHPFSWIEAGVVIGRKCAIGPFAKIRAGSKIDDEVVVGSFVEIVRTKIGSKTCVKHLTYLGDAEIGKKVNIGAGTITANFNGKAKNKTIIRDGALIGSDTVLIAPVTLGERTKTGAGAVVTARQRIPAGKTVIGIPAKLSQPKKGKSK